MQVQRIGNIGVNGLAVPVKKVLRVELPLDSPCLIHDKIPLFSLMNMPARQRGSFSIMLQRDQPPGRGIVASVSFYCHYRQDRGSDIWI